MESLKIREKKWGDNAFEITYNLNHLGYAYQKLGKFCVAEKNFKKAIQIY